MKSSKNWSPEEDRALLQLHLTRGFQSWSQIAKILALQFKILNKTPKICRQRFINHLNPQINRQEWTQREESELLNLHNTLGNRWAEISRKLPGRTDNSVKNKLFSKYRRAIKNINHLLNFYRKFKGKELKIGLVYKLINFLERKEGSWTVLNKEIVENAKFIKNEIITFEQIELQGLQKGEDFQHKIENLIKRIHKFNINIKRKPIKKKIPKNSKIEQLSLSSQSIPLHAEKHQQNLNNPQTQVNCKQQPHSQPLAPISITNLIASPNKQTETLYQSYLFSGMGADHTDNFWQMELCQAYYNI